MAEEVVVKENLTDTMIAAGAALTQHLENAGWPVAASFWLFLPEANQWRLVLASPMVASEGPKKAYEQVQRVLTQMPEGSPLVELRDITVVESDDELVGLLRSAVRVGAGTLGVRFSRNVIRGRFIDDAYVYRTE